MTHAAAVIVDEVVAMLRGALPSSVVVEAHRRQSVEVDSTDQDFVSVDFGEDEPIGDPVIDFEGTIQSLLTLNITAFCFSTTEHEVRERLLELRADIHRVIGPAKSIELEWVIDTHYAGAVAPEVTVDGDPIVGELVSQWGIRYEMSRSNPSPQNG